MKKIFNINGHEVEFSTCTANEMDHCLYVHDVEDVNGNGDGVIFGVDFPESDYDAELILTNEYIDTYFETLDTVNMEV